MAVIQLRTNPTEKELRGFGIGLPIFAAVLGSILWWKFGSWTPAIVMLAVSLPILAVALARPRAIRPVYIGWLYAVYPIGWTISHLVLGFIFYGVMTPTGFILRALGRDPLGRRSPRARESYWIERPPAPPPGRYFKQY